MSEKTALASILWMLGVKRARIRFATWNPPEILPSVSPVIF